MTQAPRLELTWPNKDKFLFTPRDQSGKPVWVDRDHPAASEVRLTDFTDAHGSVDDTDPHGDNLLFTGDSVDVLRILNQTSEYAREYRGKVKLCYIDPPFNTGQTFAHYDDWMEHATWLSFMRERLILIRDLLAPDGSVWVHLDDAENHRMRCLMDEVFGAEQFAGAVRWERTRTGGKDAKQFFRVCDTILVYGRGQWVANMAPPSNDYDYPYCDEVGPYRAPLTLMKTGSNSARSDAPRQWFPIPAPDGSQAWPITAGGKQGCWRWSSPSVAERYDRLHWKETSRGLMPFTKYYQHEERGYAYKDLWLHDEVGGTSTGKAESKALTGSTDAFSTPKPERLLERILLAGSNPGDMVLDVFAGSGTTAAVAHKMGRRWVTCELNPSTVQRFIAPRLQKVADGTDTGGITKTTDWTGGGGFRHVAVAPSMYQVTPLGVVLSDWATNGRFARAVAGQLGFEWQKAAAPFCGVKGRMRLAVLDGTVGHEEVRHLVAALGDRERVTVVAKSVLPDVEDLLRSLSPGSRVRKAPRDLLKETTKPRTKARTRGALRGVA